jgi:hypothetical protein
MLVGCCPTSASDGWIHDSFHAALGCLQRVVQTHCAVDQQLASEGLALPGKCSFMTTMCRIAQWIHKLNRLADDLAHGKLSQRTWQSRLDEVFAVAPLDDLLGSEILQRMADDMLRADFGAGGELFWPIDLRSLAGDEAEAMSIRLKLAHVQRHRSIPPHGHRNMVSGFLCLSGRFKVQLFERIDGSSSASFTLRLDQTIPQADPGSWSTVSDEHHNVHWLRALTDNCFLLTTKVVKIVPHARFESRVYLDVAAAKPRPGGLIEAPIITRQQAFARY